MKNDQLRHQLHHRPSLTPYLEGYWSNLSRGRGHWSFLSYQTDGPKLFILDDLPFGKYAEALYLLDDHE